MTMLWIPFIIHTITHRREEGFVHTFLGELISLFILFVFWLVGAAIATSTSSPISSSTWGDLGWCHQYHTCRILTALVAFAWMGWILVFALFLTSMLFCIANKAWQDPMHGTLYPRDSIAFPQAQTSEYRASRV
ncbi:hypothetical protein EWM64_g2832 [Hericium alpestre]|uniref:MARVEL domain-containing protein n=1 Tax=Hericium alpestre TaxID=135208 RepID=A0A4Z0A373_9AGAM|nr:hypothetical protein EWM64_g2832 [Hericium alpestre]